jgi:chromosome segregation ATPase
MLRSLIETRDREILNSLNLSNKEINDGLEREKEYMNKYKREIDDLTSQLKNTKINYKNYYEKASIDLHSAQRDYHIANEEKKLLNKRVNDILEELEYIKNDYENKVRAVTNYQREYENIENKYREICRNDIELKNSLNAKNKEIENLNDYIKTLKKEGFSGTTKVDSSYKDLMKKYNDILKKKKYYKEQCKIANKNIEKIIEKLKPEEKNSLSINQVYNPMLSQSEGSGA